MTERAHGAAAEVNTALKPFRLVKFFSFSALIFFMVSTIALVWLISNHTKKMLLERSEAYAYVMAQNLNHQVFQQFVLPTLLRYGKIALRNPDQFRRLDAIVRNTIHGLNMQSVTIFDREEGVVSYSTIKERVGKKGLGRLEYKKALEGENNSVLELRGSVLSLLPWGGDIHCKLSTYIPFRQEKGFSKEPGQIMGVFEIVQDLSDDFEALIKLQGVIIGTSVLIMAALFAGLWFIVAQGDRIIEQRAEERRRLEEKLNHAERLAGLGKMVASVAHEIKNPLGIVRSTAEILVRRLQKASPDNVRLAAIIVDETGRLDTVVREFLDFARPRKMEFSEVDLHDLLREAVAFIQREAEKNAIAVTLESSPGTFVRGDRSQLYRVALNILMNAVQAMPGGGDIRINVSLQGRRRVAIAFSDTGSGMSEEVRKQAFTPFFTKKTRGTGLGLAIVKNIIDAHHGKIEIDSSEGQGTTFWVTLPLG